MDTKLIDFPIRCRRTRHFIERAAERKLERDVEKLITLFGTRFPSPQGGSYAMVVRQNLPPELRKSPLVERARGWILIIGAGNTLITCIQNEPNCRKIRRAA